MLFTKIFTKRKNQVTWGVTWGVKYKTHDNTYVFLLVVFQLEK